jgi:cob(I)alamin adenosyltransferase
VTLLYAPRTTHHASRFTFHNHVLLITHYAEVQMPRLTKIYTKGGDQGKTSLGGGQRVSKDALRVEAYGTVDELNSQLGVALAAGLCERLAEVLPVIQNELFHLGSDLCFIEEDKVKYAIPQIEARHVEALEQLIDEITAIVGPLENFILPGGSLGSAHLHVARTVCRRAERITTTLIAEEAIGPYVLAYLNRLSDALFVMARYENHQKGVPEPLWNTLA